MPQYRWTGDGLYHDNRTDRLVESGEVVELDEAVGEPNRELVRVEDEADGDEEEAAEQAEDTETFDPEEWLDQDYQQRTERVQSGDVDEHLGKILQAETSETVKDAVEDRQSDRPE